MHETVLMSEQSRTVGQEKAETSEAAQARVGVVQALRDLEQGERDSMERLHSALCALVTALRRAGRSAQEVLDDIREIIAQPQEGARSLPPITREALVELSLQWCAEEYRRADQA